MQDSGEKKSYRQIFKATSIFGGVQIITIITNLLKSKILALFLGPEGMGIFYLLQNPIRLLAQLTGLGINISGIREVSKSYSLNDNIELSKTITTVRRWARLTGVFGVLITILLSHYISQWTFGNADYTFSFIVLSIVLLITALGNENDVILKGMGQIKKIALAGMYSAITSLVVSVPLYYFLRIKGIIPVLVSTALFLYIFNKLYANRIKITKVNITYRNTYEKGKEMVLLGIMLVLGTTIETLTTYIINLYIRYTGNIADVGLFQAGMQITNVSISLVYTAMASDYFPRLSAVYSDIHKSNRLVNQQAIIATLISTPILIGMITFVPFLIRLFLSSQFLEVGEFVRWILLAAMFRAFTWTIHYIILAHGDTKTYFILTLITNILLLTSYTIGYKELGLNGLGIGYLLMTIINAFYMYIVISRRYSFKFSTEFIKLWIAGLILCTASFLIAYTKNKAIMYSLNIFFIMISFIISLKQLHSKIDMKELIKRKLPQ